MFRIEVRRFERRLLVVDIVDAVGEQSPAVPVYASNWLRSAMPIRAATGTRRR